MLVEKYLEKSKKLTEIEKTIIFLEEEEKTLYSIRFLVCFFMMSTIAPFLKNHIEHINDFLPMLSIFLSAFLSTKRFEYIVLLWYPILVIFQLAVISFIYLLFISFIDIPEIINLFLKDNFVQGFNGNMPFIINNGAILLFLSLVFWVGYFFYKGGFSNKLTYSFITSNLKEKTKKKKALEIKCKKLEEIILNNKEEKMFAIKYILNKKNNNLKLTPEELELMDIIINSIKEKESLILKQYYNNYNEKENEYEIYNI